MTSSRASWLWPLAVMVAALSLVVSVFAATSYRASGQTPEPTYYACLFSGSLSQVGTTPPASCGRGEMISWNSPQPPPPAPDPPVIEPDPDPFTIFWAYVDDEGNLGRNHGAVGIHQVQTSNYVVYFEQDVSNCVYSATASTEGMFAYEPSFPIARPDTGDPTGVHVFLTALDGLLSDGIAVYLQVFCPGEPQEPIFE